MAKVLVALDTGEPVLRLETVLGILVKRFLTLRQDDKSSGSVGRIGKFTADGSYKIRLRRPIMLRRF